MIQNMVTVRTGHNLGVPAPALPYDPKQSAVVGMVDYAQLPGTATMSVVPLLGHWLACMPKKVPKDRQAPALTLLTWFQTDAT